MPKTENGVYEFKTKYYAGKIKAVAIKDGKVIGTHMLETEGKAEKITLRKEKSYIAKGASKPQDEIIYVDVRITDKDGATCTQSSNTVTYTATGADILGVASGELTTTEKYIDTTHRVCAGKCLVVLKKHKGTKNATLKAECDLGKTEITL